MDWIADELDALERELLDRHLRVCPEAGGLVQDGDRTLLNFCSNDYLDLARNARVRNAAKQAVDEFGAGAGSSRLLSGNLPIHEQLEEALASFKGYPASLAFGSGYMTNAGVLCSLVRRGDHVFADKLSHASIVDAATLSRAKLHRFGHNEVGHLDELLAKAPATGRKLVVTESVFSMDGDVAPLEDIVTVARRHDAMVMVDEAHATGVFGPNGSGLVRAKGLTGEVHLSMGTLSKALGSYGGFVACDGKLRDLLINRARSFIYTTALPPSSAAAALEAVKMLGQRDDPGGDLLARAAWFREELAAAGIDTGNSQSQIVPVIVGSNEKTLAIAERLAAEGIVASAIRPPTVPKNRSRLRFSITMAHSRNRLEHAARCVIEAVRRAEP